MSIIGVLPYGLGVPSSSDGTFTPSGVAYHYAVGGLPFLSAASHEHPLIRETAPFRKQQFDSSDEPGEQSLDGWWIRSQQTFHGGAGQLYADPSSSDDSFAVSRFYRSKGTDPWTPGQVSLLHDVESISSSSVRTITSDGVRAIGILDNDDVFFVDETGNYTTDSLAMVMGLPVISVSLDGERYYIATSTEVFYRDIADAPSDPWTSLYFTWESGPSDPQDDVVLGWVKERLVMATNHGVFELTDFDGPEQYPPSPRWTPPQGTWTPTAISESNSAIYVAGTLSGQRAVILKFVLDDTGAMPELTSGIVVANLPQGEVITSIFGYLGAFLAIGTNVGPRIAAVDTNGDLAVGPVLFPYEVGNWAARGQYLYGSAALPEWDSGEGGMVRIDLGLQHSELRFAYASDLYTISAGDGATGVGLIGAGLLLATDGGLYLESAEFVDSGWLQGPRVRYSTLEPKIYKLLRVRGAVLTSDMFASVVDPDGTEHAVVGYVAGQTPGMEDAAIPNLGPQDYLSVKLTLYSTADHLTSAVAGGYQLKSIPGQPRQRMVRLPLLCFDFETDRLGAQVGGMGTARARLAQLEALDDLADTVQFQDFDGSAVDLVAIDSVQFQQTSPPEYPGQPNWGGIITLTLRTV